LDAGSIPAASIHINHYKTPKNHDFSVFLLSFIFSPMSNFYYFPYFETICEYRERLKIESEVFRHDAGEIKPALILVVR